MKQVYLLTGRPGTGKTSLIKQAIAQTDNRAGGFYTEEIRLHGVRKGFRLVTLDGEDTILSHVDFHTPYRVSKYSVDIDGLDRVGVPALYKAARQGDVVIVDEIGKMELFSHRFREAVSWIIDSGVRILGTIMLPPDPWADNIKCHPQVNLLTVSPDNRPQILADLLLWLKAIKSQNGARG